MEKFNNLREIIENSAKKYANNIAFRVKKKNENKNVYYAICGKGPLKEYLEQLTNELGVGERVKFLGFRRDIPELCKKNRPGF